MISDSAAVAPRAVVSSKMTHIHDRNPIFAMANIKYSLGCVGFFFGDSDMDVLFYLWRVSRYGNFSIMVRTIE